ncbi:hypothetical protein l13_10790 [Neisseria weaveri ATCC 51223]|nr:hypothetical protein l13_10790 [Neisseria weaveri ATCC 51223]
MMCCGRAFLLLADAKRIVFNRLGVYGIIGTGKTSQQENR